MPASYIKLYQDGTLEKTASEFLQRLKHCDICPRKCGTDRTKKASGYCKTGRRAKVSSAFKHFGEEFPLSGYKGSGTIFFSFCNLRCVFCQNHTLSHLGEGCEEDPDDIANQMLSLQEDGAHNINFVSPTHVVPQILESLLVACPKGLKIPLVYNTGGYDSPDTIKKLKGIFDIYLPDIKYSDNSYAEKYSNAPDYWDNCKSSVKEMHNQTGTFSTDLSGVAVKGLMVRHLILPNDLSGSCKILEFIASEISKDTYINIMDQYHPCYKSYEYKELQKRITSSELNSVIEYAKKLGLKKTEY